MEASPENESQPPPRRPKKAAHGGGHGGAWKVAYADFVTAMLALFIVLWILSQDQPTKEAIAGYFRDPIGFSESMGSAKISTVPGKAPPPTTAQVMQELEKSLTEEATRMQNALQSRPEFDELSEFVDISVTDEGIRIELRDNTKFNFFEVGSANVTRQLHQLMRLLTPEIEKLGYPIAIEGHTDNRQYGGSGSGYTNWELSTERANSIRRVMIGYGLKSFRIQQVTGFSDTRPLNSGNLAAPENRRVSILIKTPLEELRKRLQETQPIPVGATH